MKIENQKVVKATYEMYVNGEQGEELIEKATEQAPLVYCHGEGMMLPKFEAALAGKEAGEAFDFTLAPEDAYGDYDETGLRELDKHLFYNADGEFDSDRVYVGNIIPMTTSDGQIVNAQVVKVSPMNVTIDLNHPLAGETLHFKGTIIEIREATEAELDAIRHHGCGGCHGNCGDGCDKCDNHSCSSCGE